MSTQVDQDWPRQISTGHSHGSDDSGSDDSGSDDSDNKSGTSVEGNLPASASDLASSSIEAPTSTTENDDHLLGPLTTVFSADPTCLTLLVGECGSSTACTGWLGQTCNLESSTYWPSNDISCWPSWTAGANIQELGGWGFYSPGLSCPSGYTSACSTTAGATGNFQFQFPPTAGETALGCCPTSFICNKVPNDNQICIRTVTSTTYTGLKCSGSIYNQLTVFTVPATTTTASVGSQITVISHVLSAQLIQLNWQSSDRASLSSSAMSTAVAEPSPSAPKQSSETRGLTAGAKAGIGIGVSFGAIGVGILIWYLVRRFQRQRTALPVPPVRANVRELDGKQMYEIPAPSTPVWELPGHGS